MSEEAKAAEAAVEAPAPPSARTRVPDLQVN
jgi:hypothetical protein